MLIRVPRRSDEKESAVTDPEIYRQRRIFMQQCAAGVAGLAGSLLVGGQAQAGLTIGAVQSSPYSTDEELTPMHAATHYNNFYELGYKKEDPSRNAAALITEPWTVEVEGHCENPGTYAVEDLVPVDQLEERIYRLRCVEAWSMVIPWLGVPLSVALKKLRPTSQARYVAFQTILDPENLPGQRRAVLDWPYVEGLRMDEAMHPLALLVTGLYGKTLPNQNGAPLRLIVPWKYGFKSLKSIVRMTFTEDEPPTTWATQSAAEYGFYSNVNPNVDHPRWSQATERRIDNSRLFQRRIETLFLNGYADEVAHLYEGMDLKKFF